MTAMRGSFVRKGEYELTAEVLDDGSASMQASGEDEGMSKTLGVAATAAATALSGPAGGLAVGGVATGVLDEAVDAVIGLLPGVGGSTPEEVVEGAANAQRERMRARPRTSRTTKEASTSPASRTTKEASTE
jgi:hypothetical protein